MFRNHIQAHIDSPHHTIRLCSPVPANFTIEVMFYCSRQLGAAILNTRETKKVRLCSPVPANFTIEVMFYCSRQLGAAILNTRETKKVRLGSPVPANWAQPYWNSLRPSFLPHRTQQITDFTEKHRFSHPKSPILQKTQVLTPQITPKH
ncbi:hypothetical protein J6590_100663 [Homalodisca vitripennis]|nr:hypothetical protein J6590_100663 [Homalodisca vitripennis]